MLPKLKTHEDVRQVYIDAAIRPEQGRCGLAAIVRDGRGAVVKWLGAVTSGQTNNEAEYEAAIFALNHLRGERARPLVLFSDSLILVQQMQGRAATKAPELQKKQAQLRLLLRGFASVRFQHIRREQNRLADALANEVVDGETPEGMFHGR